MRAITANELTDEETEFVTDKVFNFILAYKACAIELSGMDGKDPKAVLLTILNVSNCNWEQNCSYALT